MNKKNVMSITVVAMLFAVSLYFIGGTYARYADKFEGEAKVGIAAWKVSLSGGESAGKTITLPLTTDDNTDVVKGKIAPSVTASGTLEIDLEGTEVAVDLLVDVDEQAIKSALTTAGINDVQNNDISLQIEAKGKDRAPNVQAVLSGTGKQASPYVIMLPEGQANGFESGDAVEVTVKVTWKNDDSHSTEDTKIGTQAAESGAEEGGLTLKVPVKLYVVQHINQNNFDPESLTP